MTVIVVLALVALFIGLRLYSVLGERTGHEQQPILKPADQDARVHPPVAQPQASPPSADNSADLAYVPLAGPGLTNDLGFIDEFHYDRGGTRALCDDFAAVLEPLL